VLSVQGTSVAPTRFKFGLAVGIIGRGETSRPAAGTEGLDVMST